MVSLSALVLLLASCHREQIAETKAVPVEPTASTAAPATAARVATAATHKPVEIRRADGTPFLTVTDRDGTTQIAFTENGQQHVLTGESRDTGKRKYHIDSGAVLFEIKPGDGDGFKLRTPDGALRWKVKITAEKVKISDNNENDRPFELKLREAGRVKVVAPVDRELGNVRVSGAKIEVENAGGTKLYTIDGATSEAAYGVLLLDEIDPVQRYILLAELLSRGK
ncbi:MAG: hypothetical protein QOH21_2238 [Acidobacteriota bacterium]|jgi:hypothetical protein|nr:hypothetical protein [Acidobacteriota bacterium]